MKQNGSSTLSERLADELRDQIVNGEYLPEHRLPTIQQMEARHQASRGAIQLAVERLKREGFIRSRSRQGLFVVPHPPHLKRYAMVFPAAQTSLEWSRFFDALIKEGHREQQAGEGRRFETFAGVADSQHGEQVRNRLAGEVAKHRLAGLILTPGTFELASQPPFDDPALPKVFVFGHHTTDMRPIVTCDSGMIDRALEWLAGRGRQRVAVLHMADTMSILTPEHFARHGLEYRPQWRQKIGRSHPETVADVIPLLMDYPEADRPDGLFIADDNLVEHACAAAVGMGLRIGVDLDLIAHCNWPWPVPSSVPMQRIGYHAGQLLQRCIEVIDAQRQGEAFPDYQAVPALMEQEAHDLDRDRMVLT